MILDYESKTVHQMTLQAKDKAFRPEQIWGVLTVNVIDADDNPPVFTQSVYTAEIAENSGSNVVVTSVTAHDADHGNNAVVRYVYCYRLNCPNSKLFFSSLRLS